LLWGVFLEGLGMSSAVLVIILKPSKAKKVIAKLKNISLVGG